MAFFGRNKKSSPSSTELPSLSDQEFMIVDALRGNLRTGLYGLDIRRDVLETHGRSIPLGSLYVTLGRLVEKGFVDRIEGDLVDGTRDVRRQYYRMTHKGAQAMKQKLELVSARSGAPVGARW